MVRVSIITYPNCPLATVSSFCGTVLAISGVYVLTQEPILGIATMLTGIALLILAPWLAKQERFNLWIKELEKKGVIKLLSSSKEVCLMMFQANPNKMTVRFIAKHNTAVANELYSMLKSYKLEKQHKGLKNNSYSFDKSYDSIEMSTTSSTFVCSRCKKELHIKYRYNENTCTDCYENSKKTK